MIKIEDFDNIICDLDGTILNDRKRHYACYFDILKKYGGQPVSEERYWELKRNKIKRTALLEESLFKGTYQDYVDEWLKRIEMKPYLELENLYDGTVEVLKIFQASVKMNGGKLYLATLRHNRELLLWQLEQIGIKDYFDEIYSENPLIKLEKKDLFSNMDLGRVLVIGDSEADGETAKSLNGTFVAVTKGVREARFLNADYYVEELCGLIT